MQMMSTTLSPPIVSTPCNQPALRGGCYLDPHCATTAYASHRRMSESSVLSSDADEDAVVRDEQEWTKEEDDELLQAYLQYLSSPVPTAEPPAAPFSPSSPPFNITQKIARSAMVSDIARAHSLASIRRRLHKLAKKTSDSGVKTSSSDGDEDDHESERRTREMSAGGGAIYK